MTYKLRPYQQEAADLAVKHLREYGKPFVIQAATGAGKSLIIAEICHQLGEPVLILQPSKEILEQNFAKLQSYGVADISIYSASKKSKEISKYTYATIGSIYKKWELFAHFKYVILDECHLLNPKKSEGMLTSFLSHIGCQRVCGLTATPYRIVQKYSREDGQLWYTAHLTMINRIHPFFFKKIVYKIETQELIEMGYLCPIKYFRENVDLSSLQPNSTGMDFSTESLERYWNTKRIRRVVQAIQYSESHNTNTLVFCSSIRHANQCKALLDGVGLHAEIVTGETPLKEREDVIARFRSGELKHVLNVGVFTTGFDMPSLDCIVLARPTMSLALYYQMVGRGVRIDPDRPAKELQVYDLAGVVSRMGRVETIRVRPEEGGFREEVWSETGRVDGIPLFAFFVKHQPKFLKGDNE